MKKIIFCFFQSIFLFTINAQSNRNGNSEILVLDHRSIDSILNIPENHMIYFWGTWCQPCYETLDSILNLDLRPEKLKTLIVAESHSRINILEKVFENYDLSKRDNFVFGILHPKDYKKSYKRNIQIFNRFICKSCVEESKEDLRFSAVFIFDSNRRLLYYNKLMVSEEFSVIQGVINSL